MLKRPLNPRFTDAVKRGIKTTTIREKPWALTKPVMLYNWSGKAYRSPQIDVGEIAIHSASPILISRSDKGEMSYQPEITLPEPLWKTEGFTSQADMDDWFKAKFKPGHWAHMSLMQFKLAR